jgi:hypothetical protein
VAYEERPQKEHTASDHVGKPSTMKIRGHAGNFEFSRSYFLGCQKKIRGQTQSSGIAAVVG